jgi:hypothetical protein
MLFVVVALCSLDVRGESPSAGWDLQPRPLARIPAGTRFVDGPPDGWSHLVLLVESRIASGDVDVVSETVANYSQIFKPVLLANVRQDATGNYALDQVAIGFTTLVDDQHTVVTSDTYRELGARLNFVSSNVLANNETLLKDFWQVARSPANMVIDAPVVMLHEDEHVDMTLRMAVWVAPRSGDVGTAAWLLSDGDDPKTDRVLVEETFQFLPTGMREDRVLNVESSRFTFGIPSKYAFAMVQIPQGTPFPITDAMRTHAGRRRFTPENYQTLWSALATAMHP